MTFTDAAMLAETRALRRWAYRLTGSVEAAEDLLQDTFVRALGSRDRFTTGTNLRAWMFFVMRNLFLTGRRRAKFVGEMPEFWEPVSPDRPDAGLRLTEMAAALDMLNPRQREAIMAVAFGDSYEEAAQEVGCEVGTIKSNVARGRAVLDVLFPGGI